jgi:hypothetical protein
MEASAMRYMIVVSGMKIWAPDDMRDKRKVLSQIKP